MNRKTEILNAATVYVEGLGFISNTATVELPSIGFEGFEAKTGVATHEVTSTVLQKMDAKFELNEVNKVYFEAVAKRQNEKASFWVKKVSSKGGNEVQTVVTLKGSVKNFQLPSGEIGAEEKASLELNVDFFKYEMDGETMVLIDIDNMICEINGQDLWANQREFLMG
jgi:P2 family phage contractile tail tube protein